MSSSTSNRPLGMASQSSAIPIAGPPPGAPAGPLRPLGVSVASDGDPGEENDSLAMPLWTPASLKGWLGSVGLHTALLMSLALWYFSPPIRGPIHFDSRLAGSSEGVPDGWNLTGGLNMPLEMPELAGNQIEAADAPLLELKTLEPEPSAPSAKGARASGGGGLTNPNPGAGAGDGFGLARFGDGGELIRGVAVKVGDPQFTLIWDSDADLDLHVIEPGGKEIYWEEPKGKRGGELDVDNTRGFGPENIYWLVESDERGAAKVKGRGPDGLYQWFVVYWGGFGGIPKPTHWKVRIKHKGQVRVVNGKFSSLNERSKTYSLNVEPSAPSDSPADVPPP